MLSEIPNAPYLDVLGYISLAITPFMVALIGFLLNRSLNRLDADLQESKIANRELTSKIGTMARSITAINVEFGTFKRDLETALIAARQVDILKEKVAVLERNQGTIFKHIDALRDDVKLVHKDFQSFGAVISEFRRHIIREVRDGSTKTGD